MKVAKSVEEMILNLPRAEKVIVNRLRAIVQECIPNAIEKGYYGEGVPFYTHHRMICFIWPSSVRWGPKRMEKTQKESGVSLGFCQGNKMSNEDGILKSEGRKQVYVLHIHSLSDLDDGKVRALLYEAAMIDSSFKKRSHQRS